MKKVCLFFAAISLFALCTSLPVYAVAPAPTAKTIPREVKIGKKISEQLEKEKTRVLDPVQEAKLAMITRKLTPYLERDLDYSVRILDMKEPNAFSLPGGRTYVTTGMLKFLKSDAEIAAILAHEFVHADRAHSIVQAARNNRLNIISIAGMIAAAYGGGMAAAMMSSALQTAIMSSYSIDLEKEADARGIDILYRAGYNPAAMLTTMERLEVERMKHPYVDPGIFQTHPDIGERVKAALDYMKSKGIKVQRKDVLKSLKTEVSAVSGDVRLTVDGTVLLSLPDGKESNLLFQNIKKRLDDTLELELAPYDVRVKGQDKEQCLLIKGTQVLTARELVSGMPTLVELRKKIVDILSGARRANPLADYYQ